MQPEPNKNHHAEDQRNVVYTHFSDLTSYRNYVFLINFYLPIVSVNIRSLRFVKATLSHSLPLQHTNE